MRKISKAILSVLTLSLLISLFSGTSVFAATAGWEVEDNDDFKTATMVKINSSVQGKLGYGHDDYKDYYKVTVPANGRLDISFEHQMSDSYDFWRFKVYSDESGKYTYYSYNIHMNDARLITLPTIGAVAKRTYYIGVSDYEYVSTDIREETYKINIKFTPDENYEKEFNDDFKTADALQSGKTIRGNSLTDDDLDYYKIHAKSDGLLRIAFEHPQAASDDGWRIQVYSDLTGTTTYLDEKVNLNDVKKIFFPYIYISAGNTYYIKIYGNNYDVDHIGENYKLTATIEYQPKGTGLYKYGGQWSYYRKGVWTSTTGLVKKPADGKYYYVEYGDFKKATGLVYKKDTKTWHFVKKGVYTKATGLVKCVQPGQSYGKWYYVENGKLSKKTGLVKCIQPGSNNGKWFYVYKGKLKKANGIVKCIQPGSNKGRYCYVTKGKMRKVNGVAKCIQPGDKYKGKWMYVRDGKFKKTTGWSRRLTNNKKVYVRKGFVR